MCMIEFEEDSRLLTAELEIEEREKRDEDEEARYDGTFTPGGEVRASDAMRYYYYYTSGKGIYAVSDSRRRDEKLIRQEEEGAAGLRESDFFVFVSLRRCGESFFHFLESAKRRYCVVLLASAGGSQLTCQVGTSC